MKGLAPVVVIVIFLVATAVEATIFANLFFQSETIKRTVRDMTILEAINTVEFLKSSLNQALGFSFYQAAYTVAQNGGGDAPSAQSLGGPPYWRVYENTNVPDYKSNIQSGTKNILSLYKEGLSLDGIKNPDYSSVEISKTGNKEIVKVDAIANGNIISKSEVYEIKDLPSMTRLVQTNIFTLFEEPIRTFADNDADPGDIIQDKAIEVLKPWPRSGSLTRKGCTVSIDTYESSTEQELVDICISDEDVFIEATGKTFEQAKEEIRQDMRSEVEELAQNDWMNDVDFKLTAETEVNVIGTGSNILSFCSGNIFNVRFIPPEAPEIVIYDATKNCRFEYFAGANAQFKITDKEFKYSVFDAGVTERRHFALNFGAISCNVYDPTNCQVPTARIPPIQRGGLFPE